MEGKILSLQQAKYTAPGGAAGEFCGAHKLPGMERVNTRRCQADACDKRAAFAPPGADSCHGLRLCKAGVDRPCAKGETSPPEMAGGYVHMLRVRMRRRQADACGQARCTCPSGAGSAKPVFMSLPVPCAFVQLFSHRAHSLSCVLLFLRFQVTFLRAMGHF